MRIIKAVCSMQNKMLSYSGSRNLNGLLDAPFTSRSNVLLENICGAFLQKQLQDVFIHDLNFFFFQMNFNIFYLLGQLSLLALL